MELWAEVLCVWSCGLRSCGYGVVGWGPVCMELWVEVLCVWSCGLRSCGYGVVG